MKTPSLFPPGALPKGERPADSIPSLIKKWDIWALDSGRPEPGRWAGFCIPQAKAVLKGYLKGDETPLGIFAGYCRLLDDYNVLLTADSKAALVRDIAKGCEEAQAEGGE